MRLFGFVVDRSERGLYALGPMMERHRAAFQVSAFLASSDEFLACTVDQREPGKAVSRILPATDGDELRDNVLSSFFDETLIGAERFAATVDPSRVTEVEELVRAARYGASVRRLRKAIPRDHIAVAMVLDRTQSFLHVLHASSLDHHMACLEEAIGLGEAHRGSLRAHDQGRSGMRVLLSDPERPGEEVAAFAGTSALWCAIHDPARRGEARSELTRLLREDSRATLNGAVDGANWGYALTGTPVAMAEAPPPPDAVDGCPTGATRLPPGR